MNKETDGIQDYALRLLTSISGRRPRKDFARFVAIMNQVEFTNWEMVETQRVLRWMKKNVSVN